MPSLGIDYSGSEASYSLLADSAIILAGTMRAKQPNGLLGFGAEFRDLLKNVKQWYPYSLGHVFPRPFGSPPPSRLVGVYVERPMALSRAVQMAMMAGRLEMMAAMEGFEVQFVAPNSWRKVVLGHGRPVNAKQAAVDHVKGKYGFEPPSLLVNSYRPDHNICEAICIAEYGERRQA